MRHRAAEVLLATSGGSEKGSAPPRLRRDDPPKTARQSFEVLRWLEYSGLLVVLAILAQAGNDGASVTTLLDVSNLCTDTLYSALSLSVGLGLVRQEVIRRRVPMIKRYYLTAFGLEIGAAAQQVRLLLAQTALPSPKLRSRERRRARDR